MKIDPDLKNAFGSADPAFAQAVSRALNQIKRQEEEPIMKRKFRVSLAFVIIACLLLAAAAFAATRLGVLDFIVGRYAEPVVVLPSATSIIQTDVGGAPVSAKFADFAVRQAIFDGQCAYIVVAATPAEEGTLLLGLDSEPSGPVSDFGPRFENKGGSMADYAKEIGARRIAHTSVGSTAQSDIFIDTMDFMLEEDGTLVYMISGISESDMDSANIALRCTAYDYADIEDMADATLTFTLKASGVLAEASSARSAEFPGCGVRVDSVKLSATPMAVYTQVRFTVTDAAKYAATGGNIWFQFLDEKGTRIAGGATGGGFVTTLDDGETQFLQKDSLRAMETLPDTIMLRCYNAFDEVFYETQDIALHP